MMINHETSTKPETESITVYKIEGVRYRLISLDDGTVIKTSIKTPKGLIEDRKCGK